MFINSKRKSSTGTMLMNPQTFNDNMSVAFDDFSKYHNSQSSFHTAVETWTDTINDFNKNFPDANIPHPNQFRPDLILTDAERAEKEAAAYGPYGSPNDLDISWKEKQKFVENKISNYLNKLPPKERDKHKGYNYFFEKKAEAARTSDRNLQAVNQYSSSGFNRFVGTLTGGVGAGFTDPVILATLPFGFYYGAGRTFATTVLKTAAIEGFLAAGATTYIESQVLPFKKSVGIEYTVKDAAKVVLFSTIFGTALPVGVLGTGKGLKEGYKAARSIVTEQVAKLSPDLRAKLLVEEGFDDQKFLEYFAQNVRNLKPNELRIMVETINPKSLGTPEVKNAIEDIKNAIDDNLEKPFEASADGTLEHIRRMEAASDALRNNEKPRILPESTTPIDIDETRPVARYEKLKPDEIIFDAETFQFKTGGDKEGVLQTLQGIKKWDQDASNVVMVWESADGTKFIADGHQRLGLAKRINKNDPSQNVFLTAAVRREVDGWTAQEVMAEAMIQNVHMGTAKATDVARALRISPEYIGRMQNTVAPNSSLWKYANGLYKLSDEGWGYFLNAKVPEKTAALVGELVDDPALHVSILRILEKTKPGTAIEARVQIQSALDAGSRSVKSFDLFGESIIKQSLLIERGKVLKLALNKLKNDKRVMSTLIQNEQRIIQDGKNKLDTSYNRTQEEQNATAIYQIETLATRKGEISDALTRSAKLWADGNKREATETFVEAIRDAIKRNDHKGISTIGDERTGILEGSTRQISEKPEPTIRQENLNNFDDPNNLSKNKNNSDQELRTAESELLISSNNPESVNGGAIVTSPTLKSSDASTQADLSTLQATTTAPPESVFASASGKPESFIGETISIGSFNAIVKYPLLQSSNKIDELMQLAVKYQPELQSTLDSIAIGFKNAIVETRVKDLETATIKLAKRQKYNKNFDASYMGDYLGGRVLVDSLEDVKLIFNKLQEQDIKLIAVENYFKTDKGTGYRAIHANLVTKDGFSMEVQIHHKDLKKVFEQGTAYRKYKDIKRELTKKEKADYDRLAAQDKIIFDETYNQIKQREGILDDIDSELVTTGEIIDGDQIINVEKTFREFKNDIVNDEAIVNRLKDCV